MRWAVIAVLSCTVACSPDVDDDAAEVESSSQAIIDGQATNGYPAVGLLLASGSQCTGTLIGCSTVLTAGHCVCFDDDDNPGPCQLQPAEATTFFLPHRGVHQASEVILHPDYGRPGGKLTADVAIIKLEEPVQGISPMAIVQSAPGPGEMMTVVGYGRSDSFNGIDIGVKREGASPITACTSPETESVHQCRDNGDKTCQGDSGGPAFQGVGLSARIAGITSYGYGDYNDELIDCLGRKVSAEVATYADWIEDQAGIDLSTDACGAFASVGDGALVHERSATMVEGDELDVSFEVPPGTSEIYLNVNGHTVFESGGGAGSGFSGVTSYLSLTPGRPEGNDEIIANLCDGDRRLCRTRSPSPGMWTARFEITQGLGDFQLTLAAYGDAPIAEPDGYQVESGSFITVAAEDGVLQNDSASSRGGDAVIFNQPLNGQVALRPDGSFDYQPAAEFVGQDSFSYKYSDSEFSSPETVVNIEVTAAEGGCGCNTQSPTRSGWLVLLGLLALRRRRRC